MKTKKRLAIALATLVGIVSLWMLFGQKNFPDCDCDFPIFEVHGVMGFQDGQPTCVIKPCVLELENGETEIRNI